MWNLTNQRPKASLNVSEKALDQLKLNKRYAVTMQLRFQLCQVSKVHERLDPTGLDELSTEFSVTRSQN